MERAGDRHTRITRLRWRLRGAWQWPTFAAAIVVETLLLHLLPIAGYGTGVAPALLLAGLFNLVTVAVLAPLAGIALRRRRPDLPRIVARDYAGTALVIAVALLIAALGIAHHGSVSAHDRVMRRLSDAVRAFAVGHAPAAYRANVDRGDVLQLDSRLYRACVPDDVAQRFWCVLVDVAASPPAVRVDPSNSPNTSLGHPLG